jgi:hypothetical protein
MWEHVNDCGKQLTVHSKVREKVDNGYKVYDITEVEFDQYHLRLLTENDQPLVVEENIVLSCDKLREYEFQVQKEK